MGTPTKKTAVAAGAYQDVIDSLPREAHPTAAYNGRAKSYTLSKEGFPSKISVLLYRKSFYVYPAFDENIPASHRADIKRNAQGGITVGFTTDPEGYWFLSECLAGWRAFKK